MKEEEIILKLKSVLNENESFFNSEKRNEGKSVILTLFIDGVDNLERLSSIHKSLNKLLDDSSLDDNSFLELSTVEHVRHLEETDIDFIGSDAKIYLKDGSLLQGEILDFDTEKIILKVNLKGKFVKTEVVKVNILDIVC
ncbi:MAG: hypothetical protein LBV58_01255 [Acholeplasmatales bacterium]|jgi:ribosome maturation factor RimP|nr:hypothetical protein [Acholeplasmatales bacterium]